jgi:hypothetical protein
MTLSSNGQIHTLHYYSLSAIMSQYNNTGAARKFRSITTECQKILRGIPYKVLLGSNGFDPETVDNLNWRKFNLNHSSWILNE